MSASQASQKPLMQPQTMLQPNTTPMHMNSLRTQFESEISVVANQFECLKQQNLIPSCESPMGTRMPNPSRRVNLSLQEPLPAEMRRNMADKIIHFCTNIVVTLVPRMGSMLSLRPQLDFPLD